MPDGILVIGGGFAGLAAGVALAEAGVRVRLLESKPYLGGRARSWVDPLFPEYDRNVRPHPVPGRAQVTFSRVRRAADLARMPQAACTASFAGRRGAF